MTATAAELERRALSVADTHVAAYHVIRCAIDFLIMRPDLTRVLLHTLNFGSATGEGTNQSTLTTRRGDLRTEFFWSAKTYERVEEEAYVQLAGELVSISTTPCLEPWQPDDNRRPVQLELTLTLEQKSDLHYLLTLFAVDHRHRVQNAVASLVLDRLPNARTAIELLDPAMAMDEPRAVARSLIAASALALRDEVADGPSSDPAKRSFNIITQTLLSELEASESDRLLARDEDGLGYSDFSPPGPGHYLRKRVALVELAGWMSSREQADEWREVMDRMPAARAMLERR